MYVIVSVSVCSIRRVDILFPVVRNVARVIKTCFSKILNVKESQINGCLNSVTNGTAFFHLCHTTVALSFKIEIYNLDRTKSSFLATSLYKKVTFTKNWVTRFYHPTDDAFLTFFLLTHPRTGFIFRRIKSLFHHSNWQHIFLISFNGTSKRGVMHYK